MKTFEVFLKKDGKDEFRHAGSMQAPDAQMAIPLAREVYARRAEGDLMWLVDRDNLIVADPGLLAPNADKGHRHNDGKRVADHRKAQRAEVDGAAE
jgi:ring-1,2-phenylacetyl-CoA epoxidase subunit PaaB